MHRHLPQSVLVVASLIGLASSTASADAPARRVSFRESARVAIGHAPVTIGAGGFGVTPQLVVVSDSVVTTLIGDGAGGLRTPHDQVIAPDLMGLALGDVNGDGVMDVVVSAPSSGAVFTLRGGDGSYVMADTLRAPWTPGVLALWGNLYGSFAPDLVVADLFFQAIVTLRNDGFGKFTFADQFAGFVDPVAMALGVVNGGFVSDMVVADQASGTASVLLDLGQGGGVVRHDQPVGGRPVAVALADLDGDGHEDAILATQGPGALVVLLAAADGSLRPAFTYPAGTMPSALAVWDFDQDGRPDVAVADRASNSIGIWLGVGDGSLVHDASIATGAGPTALAFAQMNDGIWFDLVCANHDDGTVQVLLNTTAPPPGALRVLAPSPNPSSTGCTLSFVLSTKAEVRVEIHDIDGRIVRRLINGGVLYDGTHHMTWDGRTDAGSAAHSGLYFARVRAGSAEATTRIVLQR